MTVSTATGHPERVDVVSRAPAQQVHPAPAFTELYESTVDLAWRLLDQLGVAPAELEDALQDVFVVAHRGLPRFRGESRPSTWVGGIAVRVARDYRRRHARKPSQALGSAVELADARPGPDDATARGQAARILTTLLEQLDADQREVFVMMELEQHSAPDLAVALGIPVNTVYSRLRLARAHFNQLVDALHRGAP